ncbi:MAG: DUF1549 and DUF1553 domain-containing protein [Planctomycetales bacterium]|nr:DUF1549 and DUF1553 domain-containing protein [Planctomycetales bacterium]
MSTVSGLFRSIPCHFPAVLALAVLASPALSAEKTKPAAGKTPAVPVVEKLTVYPSRLELSGNRDSRRLIVSGTAADGRAFDLTAFVKLAAGSDHVAIDRDGFVVPKKAGKTTVKVTVGAKSVDVPVEIKNVTNHPVSFIRDVIPAISKVGCNAGTCHGAQKGKRGFKLSLRGYDPLYDYRALVDDLSGRRFNRSRPEQSLMLLKPTQGVPHEGGFLFDEKSRTYSVLKQWIAEGCRFDTAKRVARIEVFPKKPLLETTDSQQQLIVMAHFPDGTSRDVTRDAVFETSDFEVATVSKTGRIEAVRRGEAAALVRYEGLYAAAPVAIIGNREGFAWKAAPERNYIDKLVNAKLQRMKILPSGTCSDAEFLRRASIDLTGLPPTVEQVKLFLADKRPTIEKRNAKIDQLIGSPQFIEHWTLKWSDLLLSNSKFITEKGSWAFRNWIRRAVATNMAFDKFVYQLMTANGSTFENPAANYYRISREPKVVMENMTQVFIGTRFQCNQCHDHPFERWTQRQYYELSAYFAGVGRKAGPVKGEEIIYSLATPTDIKHPSTGETIPAAFPFSSDLDKKTPDPRVRLADWLTSSKNPYFAKSIVNRYWSYLHGRGIIDPVDDIRASNPPSNPPLLDELTRRFIANGFDLKRLIREMARSETYQRSFRPNKWNDDDSLNFSHASPRRLTAEQLFDALHVATGAPSRIPGVPVGFRASQIPDPKVKIGFLDMFGRPPRESPCECERSSDVSLSQTLNMINGPTVSDAIIHPEGRVAKLVAAKADDKTIVGDVYLAVICRPPTEAELKQGVAYLAGVGNRSEAAQDLMWALVNSPAFLFNR